MTVNLPIKFQQKMKEILQEEYDSYLDSYKKESYTSIRINTNKISVERFLDIFPYPLKPVPWVKDGFYVEDKSLVSKHPYYFAGLYYIQEPSAMLPSEVLPVQKGDKVLDLCAAPGGKSIRLATKLQNTGVLVSNDISSSRCQALIKNLEKFGVRNTIVTSSASSDLVSIFEDYFDCVLVDAPCSGEGMFRKEKELIKAYEQRDSSYYVPLQKQILCDGIEMVKKGGYVVYSTCTFSKEEDEEIIQYALEKYPTLHVLPIPYTEGFVQTNYGTKLFPHRIEGEGHFVCLMQLGETKEKTYDKTIDFHYDLDTIHYSQPNAMLYEKKDHFYALSKIERDISSLRLMRSGVLLAENKKGRLHPSGALALALEPDMCTNQLNLSIEDPRVMKYLKGETIEVKEEIKDGIVLVMVEGFPLGLATYKKKVFKNGYPKGWLYK